MVLSIIDKQERPFPAKQQAWWDSLGVRTPHQEHKQNVKIRKEVRQLTGIGNSKIRSFFMFVCHIIGAFTQCAIRRMGFIYNCYHHSCCYLLYVVRRRGRLAPRQPLSVCVLLPAYEGNRHLRPLGNLGHRLRRPRWID